MLLMLACGFSAGPASAKSQSSMALTKKTFDFVVGVNGNFKVAMTEAAKSASASKRYYIFFPDGEYNIGTLTGDGNQMTTFPTAYVSFIGQSSDKTVIYNKSIQESISTTATLYFSKAHRLYLQDLSILNKANYGDPSTYSATGRHAAVMEQGNDIVYKNVKLLSTQDTYYTRGTRTYWENGEIHGTTDFICGGGDVFFNKCLLFIDKDSYITAASTTTSWGYVFSECTIDGTVNSYKLGRPWSNSPKCVYINTTMKKVASAAGWGDPMNVVPAVFAEYKSKTASGSLVDLSGRRTTYTKDATTVKLNPVLTDAQAAQYTVANVLKGSDNWQPDTYTKQIEAPVVKLEGMTLTWADNENALCWAVFKDNKYVKCVTINSLAITADATAKYTVRAANEMGGLGPVSNAVAAVATSIKTNGYAGNGRALPYITDHATLKVQVSSVKELSVHVLTLSGKTVVLEHRTLGAGAGAVEIPLGRLTRGMYLIRLNADGVVSGNRFSVL